MLITLVRHSTTEYFRFFFMRKDNCDSKLICFLCVCVCVCVLVSMQILKVVDISFSGFYGDCNTVTPGQLC